MVKLWANLLPNQTSSLFELLACFNGFIVVSCCWVFCVCLVVIIGIRYECPEIKGLIN
jgi:hypothetical protein